MFLSKPYHDPMEDENHDVDEDNDPDDEMDEEEYQWWGGLISQHWRVVWLSMTNAYVIQYWVLHRTMVNLINFTSTF